MTDKLSETKKLMAALGRMPPKPHDEMKLGKPGAKKAKTSTKTDVSAKPKSV